MNDANSVDEEELTQKELQILLFLTRRRLTNESRRKVKPEWVDVQHSRAMELDDLAHKLERTLTRLKGS